MDLQSLPFPRPARLEPVGNPCYHWPAQATGACRGGAAETALRVPYYEVLYQYARWLKHQQREAEALELLDRKEVPHLHAYIKHMLQSCRADLLVSLAEREAEPKKTELLDQAKKILDSMTW